MWYTFLFTLNIFSGSPKRFNSAVRKSSTNMTKSKKKKKKIGVIQSGSNPGRKSSDASSVSTDISQSSSVKKSGKVAKKKTRKSLAKNL